MYAIQQSRYRQEVPKIPGTCWTCGEWGHDSPTCPNRKGPLEYIYLCARCMQQGHKASTYSGTLGVQQAQLAAQANLVAQANLAAQANQMGQAGNYQNFHAPSREEAAKDGMKEQAG